MGKLAAEPGADQGGQQRAGVEEALQPHARREPQRRRNVRGIGRIEHGASRPRRGCRPPRVWCCNTGRDTRRPTGNGEVAWQVPRATLEQQLVGTRLVQGREAGQWVVTTPDTGALVWLERRLGQVIRDRDRQFGHGYPRRALGRWV